MMSTRLPVILAERIVEILLESGASESEQHVALEIAKALIPVLPKNTCAFRDETQTESQ